MPATAKTLKFTPEDLEGSGGGAYAELEVPGDFPCYLADVLDYDFTERGKSKGWIFRYMVETPSGAEVKFDTYLSFGENARWKINEILTAHGIEVEEMTTIDPNDLIDDAMMAHIDFPRDKDTKEPTSDFRELQNVVPMSSTPAYADAEPEVL
jgi:hypothetical protein